MAQNASSLDGFRMKPLQRNKYRQDINVTVSKEEESSTVEKISLQIQRIFYSELGKYSDFCLDNHPPYPSIPVITDSETDADGNSVLIGEYTYSNDYRQGDVSYTTPKRSFKFKATVKKIFDEYKVNKIIYQKGDEWYKIFPANE